MKPGLLIRSRKAHLVGIGGSGMSGIAMALAARGHRVTGSDVADSPALRALGREGLAVSVGHARENLPLDTDLLIVSAAIKAGNPEVDEATARGLEIVKYAEALGGLMVGTRGIAVAGAHGKTTTAGLLSYVLEAIGAEPTFVVGGDVLALGGSSRVGAGPYLVAEACEYDRSFHHLRPEVALVTNIDEDHLDYYSGMAEITEAFREFARLLPEGGTLLTLNEHREVFERDPGLKARLTTVGIRDHADWVARDCDLVGRVSRFTVVRRGEEVARVSILLPGYHNILNALLVLATVDELGLDVARAARALEGFSGVRRQFDLKFRRGGITVIDDYAHHPAEIRATLASLRAAWPNGRIWCVFQPHQASRTRFLLREFAAALSAADRLLVPDIFFARDSAEERRRISSRDLVLKVLNLGAEAEYIPDFDEIEDFLLARLRPRDVLVTMGAGDIYRVAKSVAKRLEGYGAKSIPA